VVLGLLEPGTDIEIALAVDAGGIGVGVLDDGDADAVHERQVALGILAAEIMPRLAPGVAAVWFAAVLPMRSSPVRWL
jgi:hypothetical protein